jgi:hypothetical protein
MAYIDPSEVTSPQANISRVRPIIDKGAGEWSAALITWNRSPAVGLRWNGEEMEGRKTPHPGNPQSRGLPIWFIVPDEVAPGVLQALLKHGLGGGDIDADLARQWVEEELQRWNVAETGSLSAREDFANRVAEVVRTMKEAGEI